jgi:hypothetical protein
MDVVTLNRKEKTYDYPSKWSPDEVINYCVRLGLSPMNFGWKRRIRRDFADNIIPYDEERGKEVNELE